jgi:hypothetical protein
MMIIEDKTFRVGSRIMWVDVSDTVIYNGNGWRRKELTIGTLP